MLNSSLVDDALCGKGGKPDEVWFDNCLFTRQLGSMLCGRRGVLGKVWFDNFVFTRQSGSML